MAVELDAKYVLTGSDSTRVVFNDPTDPDFIGYTDSISGLDSPELRESFEELVEADGAVQGSNYHGRRVVTMEGTIMPDGDGAPNVRVDRLLRATNALRSDGNLRWTETGSVERVIFFRRSQPVRISERRAKKFLVALASAEPRILSSAENSLVIPLSASSLTPGRPYPKTYDYSYGGGAAGAQGYVVNVGNVGSQPRFRIDGPVTNPTILNNTTGAQIALVYTLGAGEFLDVDTKARTVLLGGTANRYSALNFPLSTWWELPPGTSDIRVLAYSYSGSAQVTVYWRSAWI